MVTTRSGHYNSSPDDPLNMALPTGNGAGVGSVRDIFSSPAELAKNETRAIDGDSDDESDSFKESNDEQLVGIIIQALRKARSRRGRERLDPISEGSQSPTDTHNSQGSRPSLHGPRVHAAITPSPHQMFTMGAVKLPALTNVVGLEGHLRRVQSILSEYGLLNDGSTGGYYDSTMSLVLESLAEPTIRKEAEYLVEVRTPFPAFVEALLGEFCDRRAVNDLINSELQQLKLERPYVRYVHGLRHVYRLHQRVFDRVDATNLIDHILLTVPRSISNKLVKRLQKVDPIRWVSALPFDSDSPRVTTVLSILKDALHNLETEEDVERRIRELRHVTDSVKRTETPAEGTPEAKKGPWLEDWVRRFVAVYKVTGDTCLTELRKLSTQLDAKDGEVRLIRSKGYGFIGMHSHKPPPLKSTVREFKLSNPKN